MCICLQNTNTTYILLSHNVSTFWEDCFMVSCFNPNKNTVKNNVGDDERGGRFKSLQDTSLQCLLKDLSGICLSTKEAH